MIINISFICVFFFEMLIATVFFNSIVERKKPLWLIFIIGTILFEIGTVINIFIVSTSWVNNIFSFTVTFLSAFLFFDIKPRKAGFYSVFLVSVSSILEHTIVFICSSLLKLYVTEYASETAILVIEITVSKILYFLFTVLLSHFLQKDTKNIKVPSGFYIFPLITLISVISFWYISISQYIEINNQIILGVICILLFLATVFVFISFQINAQKENKLLLLQQEQDKIKTDIIYYDILEQQNNNLRAYAHDAKNHLSAIKNLNDKPEIELYLSKLNDSLAEYCKVCHSGNHTLDVIIDKYVTECKIQNIKFNFDIKNNNLSQFEPYDIVTVLGNLLDNAVESAVNSDLKEINVETILRL